MKPKYPIPDPKNRLAFQFLDDAVQKYKTGKPLVLGITGAGGAGKTTFGGNIVIYYGSENCLSIDLDDYLISREERGKLGLTGYNPAANRLALARDNIENLIAGNSIKKPRYDHKTGKSLRNETILPKELIIVEGVTTLYDELRDINDISFFLDASDATQMQSRINRDVNKRGYTMQEALELFESLQPEYKRFIEPTKIYASFVFMVGLDYIMHPQLNNYI